MKALSQTEKPYHRLIVLLLAFFSFGMSAWLSEAAFERIPHIEDELAYLSEARVMARGNLVIETPEPRLAYVQPFVIDYNGNRFGKYTPGFPALLAIGVLLGQEWVINALFAALTVALVYRLGREVFGPDVGVFAAALTAFSPMALMLSASLMGHTTALFSTVLFIYAYWRIEHSKRKLQWGLIAGLGLGLLISNRPLTGIAVAAPFVAWSGVRLIRVLGTGVDAWARRRLAPTRPGVSDSFVSTLKPLIALGTIAVLMSLSIPVFNYRATGDPAANLYTLWWDYDRVGFGEGYGRDGHTFANGVRNLRFDLSLMAADLFGWQVQPLTLADAVPGMLLHTELTGDANYWEFTGISWILLPFGLVVAYRKWSPLVGLWLALGLAIVAAPFVVGEIDYLRLPVISWGIVGGLMVWLLAPLMVLKDQWQVWIWLLASVTFSLIILHLTYWVGSQRYTTRYYFEALPALALISTLPLAWLANRRRIRPVVYGVFCVILLYSLFFYTLPRRAVLNGYNLISRQIIEDVQARREGDRPVLVIVTGETVNWRSYGALLAITSPYLDSEIVVARAWSRAPREQILARFPDRQVIDMLADDTQAWFADESGNE
jgi:hypothetical protein